MRRSLLSRRRRGGRSMLRSHLIDAGEALLFYYDAKAELQGFQTVIHKGIEVTIGSDVVIDFALRPRWAWMRLENSNSSPIRTARNMAACAVREKLILYLSEP